jgi:hypothetical protein
MKNKIIATLKLLLSNYQDVKIKNEAYRLGYIAAINFMIQQVEDCNED